MVVSLLLKIIEQYPLNYEGVKVQFVTHKKETWWADEIYEDCIHVTPIAYDGEDLYYRSRYFRCPALKKWEMRSAFHELVGRYNKANWEKGAKFTQIIMDGNYCTIQ